MRVECVCHSVTMPDFCTNKPTSRAVHLSILKFVFVKLSVCSGRKHPLCKNLAFLYNISKLLAYQYHLPLNIFIMAVTYPSQL